MNTRPIGIFDSGLGGLTIVKTIGRALPGENLIYFGDTMNVPYGSKSKEAVTRFSLAIAQFLQKQNVKLIVVACNTASALALPQLQKQISVPVIGVIEPGARKAFDTTRNGKIAVLATEATVRSLSYPKALTKLNKNLRITQQACPVFVPLIEEGWIHPAAGEKIIADYLRPVIKSGADTVILGCTHYPVIKQRIAKQLGKNVQLVDSAQAVAEKVKAFLIQTDQLNNRRRGCLTVYASDDPKRFKQLAKNIVGRTLPRVLLKKLMP
ncbi:MAG: glutamate racemase [Elusimicrobiaceae bacterium]|nr:glutamate racemase [Elusimicrobiaceae bacterium]